MSQGQDLQAEYDALSKLCTQREKEQTEAETRLKMLEEREAEILKELAQFGVTDLASLDAQIKAEEADIAAELKKVRDSLSAPVNVKETVKNVDDLLELGSR